MQRSLRKSRPTNSLQRVQNLQPVCKVIIHFQNKKFHNCFNLNSDTQRKKARGSRYSKNIRDLTKGFELRIKQQAKDRAAQEKAMKKPIRLKTQMPFVTGQTLSPDVSSDSDDGLKFLTFKERCLCMNSNFIMINETLVKIAET
jgi:hypothetical protein